MSRSVPPDIIDLEDDSSDEQDVFQDFLTPDTIGDGVEAFRFSPNPSSSPINGGTRNDNYRSYESCLQEILELFPDISKDHFHELYNKQKENGNPYQQLLAQTLIEQILDQNGGQYPKEKDRIKELKRKRNDRNSDEEEAAWWKYADLRDDPMEYAKVAWVNPSPLRLPLGVLKGLYIFTDTRSRRAALQEAFELVPAKYIAEIFKEQGHYYGAFFAILEAVRTLDTSETPPFALLKSRRVGSGMSSVSLMAELREDGYDFEALKKEIDSAWKRRKREDGKVSQCYHVCLLYHWWEQPLNCVRDCAS